MLGNYKIKISLNKFKIYDNSVNTGKIDETKNISFKIPIFQYTNNIGINDNYFNEWDSNDTYNVGSICTKNNISYVSKINYNKNNNPETSINEWDLRYKNDIWNPHAGYEINRKVYYDGKLYKSLVDNNSFNIKDESKWEQLVGKYTTTPRIDEFRKYKEPFFEIGFITNKESINSDSYVDYIKSSKEENGNVLYEYVFSEKNYEKNTGIKYNDISPEESIVTYQTNEQDEEYYSSLPTIHNEFMNGVVEPPKIESNVFINRGINTSFEKHFRLGEILSVEDFTTQSDNFYNIKTID